MSSPAKAQAIQVPRDLRLGAAVQATRALKCPALAGDTTLGFPERRLAR